MRIRPLIPEDPLNLMPDLNEQKIRSDVQGSYTGLVQYPDERPVQDADDL